MESSQYGTSGIIWKRPDPKTVELSNVPPAMPPPGLPATPALSAEVGVGGVTDDEIRHFAEGMGMRGRIRGTDEDVYAREQASQADPQQRREWRKQARQFDRTLRKGFNPDEAIRGMQEMIDSGLIWMDDEGGVFSALENMPGGEKGKQRLLYAAQEWGDWYRDQIAHGEDIDRYMQDLYYARFKQAGIDPAANDPESVRRKQEIIQEAQTPRWQELQKRTDELIR
jgi:hypothetical protein